MTIGRALPATRMVCTLFITNIPMLPPSRASATALYTMRVSGCWGRMCHVRGHWSGETIQVPWYRNFGKNHVLTCSTAERTLHLPVSCPVLLPPPSLSHFEFCSFLYTAYLLGEDQLAAAIYQRPPRRGSSFCVCPCLLPSNC